MCTPKKEVFYHKYSDYTSVDSGHYTVVIRTKCRIDIILKREVNSISAPLPAQIFRLNNGIPNSIFLQGIVNNPPNRTIG